MENVLAMKILLKMRNCINYQQPLNKYSHIIIVCNTLEVFLYIIYKNLTNLQSLCISPNTIKILYKYGIKNSLLPTTRKSTGYTFLHWKNNLHSEKQQPEELGTYFPSSKETQSVKYSHAASPWKIYISFYSLLELQVAEIPFQSGLWKFGMQLYSGGGGERWKTYSFWE